MSLSVDYFQVGAHVGNSSNDHIFKESFNNKQMILIEPVPYLFKQLQKNYLEKTKNNTIQFKNYAVSNKDGVLELYVPSESNDFSRYPNWATQLASTNPEHIQRHFSDLIVEKISVPCFRLNTLIKELNISNIEYLIVDTEGHDYDILMDLDLSIVKPKKIQFENSHMDGVFLTGDKYTHLLNHFKEHGYEKIYEDKFDSIIKLTN